MIYNTKNFIEKAKNIHGTKYDYSKTLCDSCIEKVLIICPVHGIFNQVAYAHLNGHGCKKCSRKLISVKFFIKISKKIHNNFYDYSKVDFKTSKINVKIICPIHGEFQQLPGNHMRGHGCIKCRNLGFRGGYNETIFHINPNLKSQNGILYFLDFGNYLKIGITSNSIKQRFPGKQFKIIKQIKQNLYLAWLKEQKIKNLYKKYKFKPEVKFDGWTECFEKSQKLIENILYEINFKT